MFLMSDGTRVANVDDWQQRRCEMKAIIQHYQYGRVPPRPDRVTAELVARKSHKGGKGTEEWLTLVIGSRRQLRMRAVLYLPNSAPPYPVVIREEGTLGRTEQIPLFLDKGYMFIEYARHDLDPDKQEVEGPAQKAYPDFDWATLAVWAWGGSRVVDYLETRDDVDLSHIAITGHSRGGKMALLAGALDERFSLVVPNGSGAGGAAAYRVLGPGAESLGMNDKPHWYHQRIRQFAEREDRLPFDQHFLKALVAPRALLCTESLDDAFANPLGTQITSMAAARVYEFLRADPRKNGLHFRRGGHDSNTEDWQALLDFAEWHFFGRSPTDPARFWQTPLPLPEGVGLADLDSDPSTKPADTNATDAATNNDDSFLESVPVGNAGNRADKNYFDRGRSGAVEYSFEIGKHQVTNAQYAHFLNCVAAEDDPNDLYHVRMGNDPLGGIFRSGTTGRYRYRAKTSMQHRAVNFASWHDAARFCNWMHNGQPVGKQDKRTTEEGAYSLGPSATSARRTAHAKVFLPSEDEWYKAAYFVPAEVAAGHYCLFTGHGDRLSVVPFSPLVRSAYGAAEMYDDVWEWTETPVGKLFRGIRSGAWFQGNNRQAAGRFYSNPGLHLGTVGFRIARRQRQ
jgi:dienelactone hydrolase